MPAIRLPASNVLPQEIEPLLTRPGGRPSNAPVVWYGDFLYPAQSWDRARRVVAKVEWPKGELFPRVGFIVTNLGRYTQTGDAVLQPECVGALDQGRQRPQMDLTILSRLGNAD